MTSCKCKSAAILTVLIIAVILSYGLYLCIGPTTVLAMSDTSASNSDLIKVGELWRGDDKSNNSKHFYGENLTKLYSAIMGTTNADIADINSVVSSSGQLTSQNIRDNNGGKDVVVTLGSMEWTVTHITKDRSGNAIATDRKSVV